MAEKYFWIKERINPQLKASYYVACGQITAKEAKAKESPVYGDTIMHKFPTKEAYEEELSRLRHKGFNVY